MMKDEKGMDEKILCVPIGDPLLNHIEELDQVPPHLLKEIEHFFVSYKTPQEIGIVVEDWKDKEFAVQTIKESYARYEDYRKDNSN